MYLDTQLARYDACPGDPHRPSATPIYQTATFEQESAERFGSYDYSRSGNPTRAVLEERLAALEGGRFGFAFASGMAALAAVTRLVRPGQRVLAGADLYGGTVRLLERQLAPLGVELGVVDCSDLGALERELAQPTRLLLFETPTNPLLRVADLAAAARLARAAGALTVVDNTALSPYLQNPLALGVDLVVHSATKHLCGHGDATAGALVTSDPELAERIRWVQNAEGTALAPFDAWLVLRGLKTLGVRLEREQQSALELARFLEADPRVAAVHYPGLESHPGHGLQARQARGWGQLVSFETGSLERSVRVVEDTQLFSIAVSFGSTSSTMSLPCRMSHASVPADSPRRGLLPRDLVRISLGLEDSRDLVADLDRALGAVSPGRAPSSTLAAANGSPPG